MNPSQPARFLRPSFLSKFLATVSIVVFALGPSISIARTNLRPIKCAKALTLTSSESNLYQSELSQNIHSLRRQNLSYEQTEIVVNRKKYLTIGLLGASASSVYLARAENGNLVTIKMIESERPVDPYSDSSTENRDVGDWADSVYYEVAATNFYLENGERVPRIIDYQVFKKGKRTVSAILVKEYREGILYSELEQNITSIPKKWKKYAWLLKELPKTQEHFKNLHKEFEAWLKKKKINLDHLNIEFLGSLLEVGDLSRQNFLFDAEIHEWIPFDF